MQHYATIILYICIYTHIFCTYMYIYTSYIRLCIICISFWLQPQTRNIWRSRSSTTRLLHESLQRSFRRFAAIWRSSERRYKSLVALLTQYDSAKRCFCFFFILRKNDTYLDTDNLYICVYIHGYVCVYIIAHVGCIQHKDCIDWYSLCSLPNFPLGLSGGAILVVYDNDIS